MDKTDPIRCLFHRMHSFVVSSLRGLYPNNLLGMRLLIEIFFLLAFRSGLVHLSREKFE